MTIHSIIDKTSPEMQQALATFEKQFRYPLGPECSFSITHGDDYPRFCRAIGEGCCFVAEHGGIVLGTVGVSIRPVQFPDGKTKNAAYICDVKTSKNIARGFVLIKLFETAMRWGREKTNAAFGVVMDGTSALPTAYTGRLGIPSFTEIGKVTILNIATTAWKHSSHSNIVSVTEAESRRSLSKLAGCCYVCAPGKPSQRSKMQPQWLMHKEGNACGVLEDTALAKQLMITDQITMESAHLSGFAYSDVRSGAKLILHALQLAKEQSYHSMFVSVPKTDANLIVELLGNSQITIAHATLFGAGFDGNANWLINSSEI